MTQEVHDEFGESLESAQAWMLAVQERLKVNDNTKGPRAALEARLRETEKIWESEHDGKVKMDIVFVAGEAVLQCSDEDQKHKTLSQLKEIKSLWEETCTYIIHCHSRIEWVWLHWSEYLKAHEEFGLWLGKMKRTLEPNLELQLGLKEKHWQLDHHRVLLSDIVNQAVLLERLLDEAATLYNRTQDPSVDSEAQERLKGSYEEIRTKAQERMKVLEKIVEEHQLFKGSTDKFRAWLCSKEEEINQCSEMTDSTDEKQETWKDILKSVKSEEKTLQHIERLAVSVKNSTSPLGAEKITQEVEELRQAWESLRLACEQEQERLQNTVRIQSEYTTKVLKLKSDIAELRKLVQKLNQDLEFKDVERTEEQMVALWRKFMAIRTALAVEESRVERLKAQLKELFRFSQNVKPHSDDVLAAVKEYHSVKGKAFKLSTETESSLRQLFQDPLRQFVQWRPSALKVLENSSEVTDFSLLSIHVQQIETLLCQSSQLHERLSLLHVKQDLLGSIFTEEKAKDLKSDLVGAVKEREHLHNRLLQTKSRLQSLISRTKDFDVAYGSFLKQLADIRVKIEAENALQPDILTKKAQFERLEMIQNDLADFEAHSRQLESLASSNPAYKTQIVQLSADWKALYRSLKIKLQASEHAIYEHECCHGDMLNLEHWLMETKQKLELFRSSDGEWNIENHQAEVQELLAEFSEKDILLHQVESQGDAVLTKTSSEGRVHIQRDLEQLRESRASLLSSITSLRSKIQAEGGNKLRIEVIDFGTEERKGFRGEGYYDSRRGSNELGVNKVSSGDVPDFRREGDYDRDEGGIDSKEDCNVYAAGDYELKKRCSERGFEYRGGDDQQIRGTDLKSEGGGGGIQARNEQYKEYRRNEFQKQGSSEVQGNLGVKFRGSGQRIKVTTDTPDGYTMDDTREIQGHGDYHKLQKQFEKWLRSENGKLTKILIREESLSSKELKSRQEGLKELRSRIPMGQDLFQSLLKSKGTKIGEDAHLEDLRYRWMLYKSKLKDVGDLKIAAQRLGPLDEPIRTEKKRSGFLYRVCCAALPLQLILLALLLLAFLLPLVDEGASCSLANNFARSFSLMLRYDGPPPT
ncbi:nesprin-3 isoform X1 [Polyodon spathula]|uniref:nesprin-3 isoform X1 n=1 Tax=Polyodon spathula TaxID=7913 RepID=UPI001B7DFD93|nr:nesprin-3 isoform X1 [Polyodon spathula]XP_041131746.1 nesprin-3 isoform X1 [Polyodon spathula]XP_041131747.1 nesprin-3 isoform X1 [Polyodon spathula]